MALSDAPWNGHLATITHAKLRASQGDVASARRILEAILAAQPGDREALELLGRLGGVASAGHSEPGDDAQAPPQPSVAAELRGRFRSALGSPRGSSDRLKGRLEDLLTRIDHARSREHVR